MGLRLTTLLIACCFVLPGFAAAEVRHQALAQLQENFNMAVAAVRPGVVCIKATRKTGNQWIESIGSGFVVDERGYILTNQHVVADAVGVEISFWRSPPRMLQAKVIHEDAALDLALLQVKGKKKFTPVVFGNSEQIEMGDWVMSVGSPFGFEHSIALGIVSAANRNLRIQNREYENMIQTDAVINEGNSGGPLIDIFGRVVGITTAIYAPDGTYTGLGFAIPVNRAKAFFSRITGALAALPLPAIHPLSVLPIDLNAGPPNDFNHIQFRDCTRCHQIIAKKVVVVGAKRPHPTVGNCDKCHIFEKKAATGAPVTVATPGAFRPMVVDQQDFWIFFKARMLKSVPLLLISSVIFSMLGLGGGFFYVPILLYSGIDFHTATTSSLLMLTLGSLSAMLVFFKSRLVDMKLVAALSLPAMIGAFMGGVYSNIFEITTLYFLFSITLFAAAYFMIKEKEHDGTGYQLVGSSMVITRLFHGQTYSIDLLLALPLVAMVSFLGGVLGVAGGWFIVPMLTLFFGVPMRVAVASSSLLVPINGTAGFLGHGIAGHIDWQLTIVLSLVAVIGAQIGARISTKADTGLLRVIFTCVLGMVGLWMMSKVIWVG
ncbi:MAG: TSUP family transporter [Desulfobulbaceae bacterium]|nr:TSUP family transporter [Desulfobulbaceae bacterium]HIJ79397.1 TSUP family transporter [Deltaproteobacteria bacterium]